VLISVPFPHHKSFLLSKCFDHTQTWTGDQQRFAIWETAIATATHYAAVARCVRARAGLSILATLCKQKFGGP